MAKFTTIPSTIIVDCADYNFGAFDVLIVPERDSLVPEAATCREFYLRHRTWSPVVYMGTFNAHSDEEFAKLAHDMALDYIPDFIEQCK